MPIYIDVRTPAEYAQGHIPGAVNLPLFTNEERHKVGLTYKQKGPKVAYLLGLELTSPRFASMVKQAEEISNNQAFVVYCWRGGMRSGSLTWLFQQYGLQATQYPGGYKAFRKQVIDYFNRDFPFISLTGRTGSGKTRILQFLEHSGHQVLDLEALAHHRGSAFGHLGMERQPSSEHFENLIFDKLSGFDHTKTIYIEDESRNVGSCFLAPYVYDHVAKAPKIYIDASVDLRIENIFEDYGQCTQDDLIAATAKLTKRLGLERTKEIQALIAENQIIEAIKLLLPYYDKLYDKSGEKNFIKNIKIDKNTDFSTIDFT